MNKPPRTGGIPVLFVIAVIIVIAGVTIRKRKEEYPDRWEKEFK